MLYYKIMISLLIQHSFHLVCFQSFAIKKYCNNICVFFYIFAFICLGPMFPPQDFADFPSPTAMYENSHFQSQRRSLWCPWFSHLSPGTSSEGHPVYSKPCVCLGPWVAINKPQKGCQASQIACASSAMRREEGWGWFLNIIVFSKYNTCPNAEHKMLAQSHSEWIFNGESELVSKEREETVWDLSPPAGDSASTQLPLQGSKDEHGWPFISEGLCTARIFPNVCCILGTAVTAGDTVDARWPKILKSWSSC